VVMKSWRRGFIRWRIREGPWGSHQVEARALKCETSEGLTEEEDGSGGGRREGALVERVRRGSGAEGETDSARGRECPPRRTCRRITEVCRIGGRISDWSVGRNEGSTRVSSLDLHGADRAVPASVGYHRVLANGQMGFGGSVVCKRVQ